jgi:predicted DNA-binding protein YlxM (UPF0122 family)
MTNQDKAAIYDNCLRESDMLQRQNSKLKSEYAGNIPPMIQEQINRNDKRIAELVAKLESLFK